MKKRGHPLFYFFWLYIIDERFGQVLQLTNSPMDHSVGVNSSQFLSALTLRPITQVPEAMAIENT